MLYASTTTGCSLSIVSIACNSLEPIGEAISTPLSFNFLTLFNLPYKENTPSKSTSGLDWSADSICIKPPVEVSPSINGLYLVSISKSTTLVKDGISLICDTGKPFSNICWKIPLALSAILIAAMVAVSAVLLARLTSSFSSEPLSILFSIASNLSM